MLVHTWGMRNRWRTHIDVTPHVSNWNQEKPIWTRHPRTLTMSLSLHKLNDRTKVLILHAHHKLVHPEN